MSINKEAKLKEIYKQKQNQIDKIKVAYMNFFKQAYVDIKNLFNYRLETKSKEDLQSILVLHALSFLMALKVERETIETVILKDFKGVYKDKNRRVYKDKKAKQEFLDKKLYFL